ncbi:DUF6507 family protein [Streptomyces prasinus]
MPGWDISPSGVQRVLPRTAEAAEGLSDTGKALQETLRTRGRRRRRRGADHRQLEDRRRRAVRHQDGGAAGPCGPALPAGGRIGPQALGELHRLAAHLRAGVPGAGAGAGA